MPSADADVIDTYSQSQGSPLSLVWGWGILVGERGKKDPSRQDT